MKRASIPTRTGPVLRLAYAFWRALDEHPALPMILTLVLLCLVNSPLFD